MGRIECPAGGGSVLRGRAAEDGSPESPRRIHSKTALFFIGVVLLAAPLAGCRTGHIHALREAENTFNEAAAADNRERLDEALALMGESEILNSQRLDIATKSAIGEIGRAATGYRLAAKMADELISRKGKELFADDLLCTTYLIKAMSLWKLGEYEEAMGTAESGENCSPASPAGSSTPREITLLKVIPGLARIDDANALLMDLNASPGQYRKIKTEIEEALTLLKNASSRAPADHPIRVYLLISRMAAIRVWQTAIDKNRLTGTMRETELKDTNDRARETWDEYRQFLECRLHRRNDPSISSWANLFGISVPSEPMICP